MPSRARRITNAGASIDAQVGLLRGALRRARIENAEKSAAADDLQAAEIVRLELLNEALDPLFAELPADVDLFDRGVSKGAAPGLWIDALAHVEMARDKRCYRFVMDSRYSRKVLAESEQVGEIVASVSHYVAWRMIERERALAEDEGPWSARLTRRVRAARRRRQWRMACAFLFGVAAGAVALFAALWIIAARIQH